MIHDFEAALSEFDWWYDRVSKGYDEHLYDKNHAAILFALKLAHKVTQEPSEGMVDEADIENMQWAPCADYDVIFKAMIKKACEEVECE